ncbi:MAG: hypothetical protein ABIJ59_04410 [Pseudomonadota bacterium]
MRVAIHSTMLVHFRKRITREMLSKVNEAIHKKSKSKEENDDVQPPANKGKLLIYATCAPADITFPTDLKLLNKPIWKGIADLFSNP